MTKPTVWMAYNWLGPCGPIENRRTPDVYDFAAVENFEMVEVKRGSKQEKTLFGGYCVRNSQGTGTNYQITGTAGLKRDDIFVYPITMGHHDSQEQLFSEVYGIFERSRIPRFVLDKIRCGVGYILLEHGWEAFVTDHELDCLHRYMKLYDIPLNKVIYASGTGNIHEIYLSYCERRNIPPEDQIKFLRYFPSLEAFARSEVVDPHEPDYDPDFIPEKKFLSLNLRPRSHRSMLLGLFYKNNLLDDSYFSFCGLQHTDKITEILEPHHMAELDLDGHIFHELNEIMDRFILDAHQPENDRDVTFDVGQYDVMNPYYRNSLVTIATETTFYTNIMAVTEKAFKGIKYKHPFILVGTHGLLNTMKDMGYKTFSDFWDESYDLIETPHERMQAVVALCRDIATWSDDKVREFRHQVKPILEHNYQHLLANPYSEVYTEMYDYVINHSKTVEIWDFIT